MITAVIKAKNEALRITGAVSSARLLADAVIVIDDDSTDGTPEIARSAGAEVIPAQPHDGQIDRLDRQAFERVHQGWILRMDADERLTESLALKLRALADEPAIAGVRYSRLNYMFGEEVRYGGWFVPHQLGFFRASAWDRSWTADLHSQVPVVGKVVTIRPETGFMEHHDYDNIRQFVTRSLLGYAAGEAQRMHEVGVRFRKSRLLISPVRRIWGRYFIRQGYKDGPRGLVLAALLGAYDIARWSYLWELEKNVTHASSD